MFPNISAYLPTKWPANFYSVDAAFWTTDDAAVWSSQFATQCATFDATHQQSNGTAFSTAFCATVHAT